MGNKDLIAALRKKFAPTVREMCADDKFDCDALCAGNILTSECIVFQAADAIEALDAEMAAYRELGPIAALTALVKAVKDGRVVVLPCKTGVTAWNIKSMFSFCSEPKEEVIDRFVVSDGGVDVAFRSGYKFSVERIGKTVFLTRAEAEAALKGASDV